MKRTLLNLVILLSGVSLLTLSACRFNCVHGSGNTITETRKVGDFSKIDVSGDFKIILKQDSSQSLIINADDNLLKYIKTSVTNGKLKIYTKKSICNRGALTVTIGLRDISDVNATGAISIESAGKITTKDIHFDLSGATKLVLDLNAANVSTDASGVTKIKLTGQASSHHIDMSGGGKLEAFDFVVGDYDISTSGASKCQINVLNTLNIQSTGASSVEYRGNPKTINNDKSGASSIKKVD